MNERDFGPVFEVAKHGNVHKINGNLAAPPQSLHSTDCFKILTHKMVKCWLQNETSLNSLQQKLRKLFEKEVL
ncbi:MAG: hypothetical protein GY820_36560 [Gammaproteobacteria bacterium]|nr:hypothetical protein [Gammaproteobacteria bacterium]